MKQLIMIRGGTIFPDIDAFCEQLEKWEYDPFKEEKKRKDRLQEEIKDQFQYICPSMPNKHMANYRARKIRFEKIFPYLNDDEVVVVGHSL